MTGLVTLPGVDILAAGTWNLSTGATTFTPGDLAEAIRASKCTAVGNPIIKIGHNDPQFGDGEPALGKVTNMTLTQGGNKITGDLAGMPSWLGDVLPSAFPSRSIEGAYDFRCQIGHVHKFVISALALLGVTSPGVGVLSGLDRVKQMYSAAAQPWRTVASQGRQQMGRTIDDAIRDAVARRAIRASDTEKWRNCTVESIDIMYGPVWDADETQEVRAGRYSATLPGAADSGDPMFARNPLLAEMRERHPGTVAAASAEASAPKLFGDDDLPLTTASGNDPALLLRLPWPLRHAAAAAPDAASFHRICEMRHDVVAVADHREGGGNADYMAAFSDWLRGPGRTTGWMDVGTQASADEDYYTDAEIFNDLFGGSPEYKAASAGIPELTDRNKRRAD